MADPVGISVPFTLDQTGYPAPNHELKLINDSIFTILSTVLGERVHQPEFGCLLMQIIFEPLTLATIYRAEAEIRRAVAAWEPRASVTTINFSIPNDGVLQLDVNWVARGGLRGTTTLTANTQVIA